MNSGYNIKITKYKNKKEKLYYSLDVFKFKAFFYPSKKGHGEKEVKKKKIIKTPLSF